MNRSTLAAVPLVSLVVASSCASTEIMSETDRKLAALGISRTDLETSDRVERLWQTYIQGVIYVGFPEENFLRSFTKSGRWDDVNRPYIVQPEASRHRYVITEIPTYGDKYRARLTFINGTLVKYEQFGRGENPWGYTDCTFLLRPAKDVPASWK